MSTPPPAYYCGIDISPGEGHAVAIAPAGAFGNGEWRKVPVFTIRDNRPDYDRLLAALGDPTQAAVAMEPTGTVYTTTLRHHLTGAGVRTYYVESLVVKAYREILEKEGNKTDPVDARIIAKILHEALTARPHLVKELHPREEAIAITLRQLLAMRRVAVRASNQATNRLRQVARMTFPEAEANFWPTLVRILPHHQKPAEIASLPIADLKKYCPRGAQRLQDLARATVGVTDELHYKLAKDLAVKIHQADIEAADLEQDIGHFCSDHPDFLTMHRMGLGLLEAANVIAATRSAKAHPDQESFVRALTLAPKNHYSGKTKRGRLQKKGPKYARSALILWAMRNATQQNATNRYSELYKRKVAQGKPKMMACTIVAAEFSRHLWHAINKEQAGHK